jgi:heavy metal translocating P-type ATPase
MSEWIVSSKVSSHQNSSAIVCRSGEDCDDLDLKLSHAWLRIAVAGVFAGQGMVFSLALNMTPPPYGSLPYLILHGGLIVSSFAVMAFLGGPLFASTWGMLRSRRLSIEGLFTVSLLGAFVGSVVGSVTGEGHVFYEVVAIVIAIYTFGRMLGERSQAQLKLESARLRESFDQALVSGESAEWELRPIAQVPRGARVRVEPGAAFTLDGLIISGVGYVQETALTGEPLPVVKRPGDFVRAGTWAIDSRFEFEVQRPAGTRELDLILNGVDAADGRPSELQTQANQLIRTFLPVVVGVSLATAIFWGFVGSWVDAVLNSMAVLLVACPCALGLATPVAISQGLFRLAQLGLISRDGALIDVLARTRQIFFDKTGTLSESALRVSEFWMQATQTLERAHLLAAILSAESGLTHPVARALTHYLKQDLMNNRGEPIVDALASSDSNASDARLEDLHLLGGQGIEFRLKVDGRAYLIQVGEASLCDSDSAMESVMEQLHEMNGKRIFVYVDGAIAGCFVLQERLREGVAGVWQSLKDLEIKTKVLTGDPKPDLQLPNYIRIESGMRSSDKVDRVAASKAEGESPLFVGDGINDAVAMATASASIAMHSGTGLARSVAMAQLSGDRIEVIPQAIQLARGIHQCLYGNLIYAATYNVVGMALAASGILHPIIAAILMLVSSFFVTTRVLRFKKY